MIEQSPLSDPYAAANGFMHVSWDCIKKLKNPSVSLIDEAWIRTGEGVDTLHMLFFLTCIQENIFIFRAVAGSKSVGDVLDEIL